MTQEDLERYREGEKISRDIDYTSDRIKLVHKLLKDAGTHSNPDRIIFKDGFGYELEIRDKKGSPRFKKLLKDYLITLNNDLEALKTKLIKL